MSEQESTTPPPDTTELEQKIKSALREVYDPELGMSVVELGLIRQIDLQPGLIEITMILTSPFCPLGPQLLEEVRHAVERATTMSVHVTRGTELWQPSMMEGGAGGE